MRMLYLSEGLTGRGTKASPYRPAGYEEGADYVAIGETGNHLMLLSKPSMNPALTLLAVDKDDTIDAPLKDTLSEKTGVELESKKSKASDTIAEILIATLSPTKDRKFDIWLGGERWYSQQSIKGGATASDPFTYTENPIYDGGKWLTPLNFAGIQSVSGEARPIGPGGDTLAQYVGGSFLNDQSSKIYVSARASNHQLQGACTRIQGDGAHYNLQIAFNSTTDLQLYRVDAGHGFFAIGGPFSVASVSAPYDIMLDSNGSSHTLYFNGVPQGTRTDGNLTGGSPGLYLYAETSASNSAVTQIEMNGYVIFIGFQQQPGPVRRRVQVVAY